ncbi:MAG: FtsQ-type POTRA domain-containing protein [Parvularculaceae bacterium]|nr:FtsQ-type POTRA domain-containing protein [Parvularculaceae bacterium]
MRALKKKKSKRPAPSAIERVAGIFERYTVAGIAGSAALLGLIAIVLWAGGYFGLMGRAIDRAANETAIAAGLEIRRVLLRGAHQTAHEEVLDALGPVVGASLLHLSLDEARARIENLGWVRSAAVTRLYPDTISVSIREREPAAVWQIDGDLHLIDAEGAIIREVGAYEYSNLPLIVGAGAQEAASGILSALARETEIGKRAYALIRVGGRRWNMRLRNNVDVKLPERAYVEAIADLGILQEAQGLLDQEIEYIDLRDPERMVIRKRGEAAPTPARAMGGDPANG